MLNFSTHPADAVLTDFVLGKLPDPADAEVENHLAACPECQARAAAASAAGDTLVSLLASAGTRADADRSAAPTPTLSGGETPSLLAATRAWDEPTSDEADPPPALAGHPKYRVVRRLGVGGMWTVWLAEHAVMNRPVAVKVIRPELLARPGAAERFLREVRAAAKLHHRNIVTAYDAEQVGDSCLLVMEYVDGETLAERVKAGPLPVAEACRATRGAALGLAHAHAAGLVHRDVKPHNLIRAADGTVKVLDFGLAGVAAGETIVTAGDGLTGAGMVCGTPDYIAPEQIADPHAADARSDLYGLGCTFYHLLAGRVPFAGGTVLEKLTAQEKRVPEPIPELAPDLAAVLAKLLAKRPEDRYQTADEVVAALEAVLANARAKGGRPPRPRRRWLAAAGLLFALLAAGAAAVQYRIKTDTGELVIETTDDDVEVVVKQGGQLVTIYDPKSKQKLILKSGTYEFELNGKPTGFKLDIDRATLKRGDVVVAKITREPQPAVKPGPRPTDPTALPPTHAIQFDHGGKFTTLDVSPDGTQVIASRTHRKCRLYDARTGGLLREINDAELSWFTPDGKYLLHSGWQSFRVVEAANGKRLHTLVTGDDIGNIIPIPGSTRVGVSLSNRLQVWDLTTGAKVGDMPWSRDYGWVFVPGGEHIVFQAYSGSGEFFARDLNNKPTDKFNHLRELPPIVRTSTDGKWIVCMEKNNLAVYDGATGKRLHALESDPKLPGQVGIGRDRVVTSLPDRGTLGVWDLASGKLLHKLRMPEELAGNVAWTPRISLDGKTVVAGQGTTVYIWRLDAKPSPRPILTLPVEIAAHAFPVALSADGQLVANPVETAEWQIGSLRIFSTQSGELFKQVKCPGERMTYALFTPDKSKLVAGVTTDQTKFFIRVWDLKTGTDRKLDKLDTIPFWPTRFALSRDGTRLAMTFNAPGDRSGEVRVVDLVTNKTLLTASSPRVTGVVSMLPRLSDDGKCCVTTIIWSDKPGEPQTKGHLRIDDLEGNGKPLLIDTGFVWDPFFDSATGNVGALRYTKEQGYWVEYWDPATGKPTRQHPLPKTLESVKLGAEGKRALAIGFDKRPRVLDLPSGNEVLRLDPIAYVTSYAISADGRTIHVGDQRERWVYRLPELGEAKVTPKP